MFEAIKEELRQNTLLGKDSNFLKDLVYYFELKVPSFLVTGGSTFFFPLVMNPEGYTLSEPFSITKTEGQGGGLYVEENGIIYRMMSIKGHTGWKPRKFLGDIGISAVRVPETQRSFSRQILNPIAEISGQKHFQFLQDAVFRTYGDLKRDPSTSENTHLYFHIPKEDEHWEVKPLEFRLEKTLNRKNLYPYTIDLLIVGPHKDPGKDFSEDKSWLDKIKDGIRMVQSGIDLVKSIIQDVVAYTKEIERTIKGIGAILSNIVSIIDIASDFINGVTEVIIAPAQFVSSVIDQLETSIRAMVESARQFPDTIINSYRTMGDGLNRIRSFPQFFQSSTQTLLQSATKTQDFGKTSAALIAAASSTPPNSFQKLLALGTGNLPGDLGRARADLNLNRPLSNYQSAEEKIIQASDTLQSLSAKYLGDARLWRDIAVLNNLTHPFISKEGIPGTKKPGERILIPSTSIAPDARNITTGLGISPEASAEERLLQTDFMLERVDGPNDLFDFAIDTEGGSVDVRTVSGVNNLSQALLSRLRTERGTDQLYKNVGIDRLVGSTIPSLGAEIIALRIAQAVKADPRITSIKSLDIEQPTPDSIIINLDAEVISTSGSTPIVLRL